MACAENIQKEKTDLGTEEQRKVIYSIKTYQELFRPHTLLESCYFSFFIFVTGPEGAKGPKGDKGEAAPDGAPGEKGEKGREGLRGPKGELAI